VSAKLPESSVGKSVEEGVMIPHMPLLREAEASSYPMWPATVPGPERQGTRSRDSGVWGRG